MFRAGRVVEVPLVVGDSLEGRRGTPSEKLFRYRGNLSVGKGVAETRIGLHQVVVEMPLFHAVLFVISIPKVFDAVALPLVAGVVF